MTTTSIVDIAAVTAAMTRIQETQRAYQEAMASWDSMAQDKARRLVLLSEDDQFIWDASGEGEAYQAALLPEAAVVDSLRHQGEIPGLVGGDLRQEALPTGATCYSMYFHRQDGGDYFDGLLRRGAYHRLMAAVLLVIPRWMVLDPHSLEFLADGSALLVSVATLPAVALRRMVGNLNTGVIRVEVPIARFPPFSGVYDVWPEASGLVVSYVSGSTSAEDSDVLRALRHQMGLCALLLRAIGREQEGPVPVSYAHSGAPLGTLDV